MKNSSFIAAGLIIMLFIHEARYYSRVVIKTSKSKFMIAAVFCGIAALAVITYFFAKYWVPYLLFACCTLFVLADVWKQRLSKEGVLIVARGKEIYKWEEIHHAKIKISYAVKITYFANTNSTIATHQYKISDYDKILELLQTNHIYVM